MSVLTLMLEICLEALIATAMIIIEIGLTLIFGMGVYKIVSTIKKRWFKE